MTNTKDFRGHGNKGASAGVSGLSPLQGIYIPKKHNPPAPMRPGSMDAFNLPSIDHTGKQRPYWGSK